MASHDGLKYVLETKKGYVKEDGCFTDNPSEALLIDFWQFGFGPEASEVYRRLGFDDIDVLDSGVSFHTIIPSFEARDSIGISYYLLMGFDYNKSCTKASSDYYYYSLHNDDNCLRYEKMLKAKVLDYYENTASVFKVIKMGNNELALYETPGEDKEVEQGLLKRFIPLEEEYTDIPSL